ncbi:MAG: hypothetical protein KAS67_05360 [Thermoplasmata archaeon]|nr:hypothetical protein [Thermoplasmata archaeon]
MERDWLRILTGILALGFGIYCFGLAALVGMDGGLSSIFTLICIIYGVIYLIYGASLLFVRSGKNLNFLAFGFVIGSSWWFGGLPWYAWPIIIMPIIILVLTIIIILRHLSNFKIMKKDW